MAHLRNDNTSRERFSVGPLSVPDGNTGSLQVNYTQMFLASYGPGNMAANIYKEPPSKMLVDMTPH